jgi:hypothetical protein
MGGAKCSFKGIESRLPSGWSFGMERVKMSTCELGRMHQKRLERNTSVLSWAWDAYIQWVQKIMHTYILKFDGQNALLKTKIF